MIRWVVPLSLVAVLGCSRETPSGGGGGDPVPELRLVNPRAGGTSVDVQQAIVFRLSSGSPLYVEKLIPSLEAAFRFIATSRSAVSAKVTLEPGKVGEDDQVRVVPSAALAPDAWNWLAVDPSLTSVRMLDDSGSAPGRILTSVFTGSAPYLLRARYTLEKSNTISYIVFTMSEPVKVGTLVGHFSLDKDGAAMKGCVLLDQGVCLEASDPRVNETFAFAFSVQPATDNLRGITFRIDSSVEGSGRTAGDAVNRVGNLAAGVASPAPIVFAPCAGASGCWSAPVPSPPAG